MMRYSYLLLMSLLLLSMASAQSIDDRYDNCGIYGTCPKAGISVMVNNATLNVNNSNFLRGYSPDTLNSTFIAPLWSASLSYTNTVVNGNTTAIVAGILNNFTAINANVSASYVPYVGANANVYLTGVSIMNMTSISSDLDSSVISTCGNCINLAKLNTPLVSGSNITLESNESFIFGKVNANASTIFLGRGGSGNFLVSHIDGNFQNVTVQAPQSADANGIFAYTAASNIFIGSTNAMKGNFFHTFVGANNVSVKVGNTQGIFVRAHINNGADGSSVVASSTNARGSNIFDSAFAANQVLSVGAAQGSFIKLSSQAANSNVDIVGSGATVLQTMTGVGGYGRVNAVAGILIGRDNLSCTATGCMAIGQNINITGTDVLGFNTGGQLYIVGNNRVTFFGTNAVGLNITNPQALLHVNGTSQFESNATFILNATTNNFFVGKYANSTGSPGYSGTINLVNSTLQNCTLTFSQGLAMGTTC